MLDLTWWVPGCCRQPGQLENKSETSQAAEHIQMRFSRPRDLSKKDVSDVVHSGDTFPKKRITIWTYLCDILYTVEKISLKYSSLVQETWPTMVLSACTPNTLLTDTCSSGFKIQLHTNIETLNRPNCNSSESHYFSQMTNSRDKPCCWSIRTAPRPALA